MRFVPISRTKPGMILARAIFDSDDRILLGSQVELKQDFIEHLNKRGYSGVYIEDEISKEINIQEAISQELRHQGVKSLKHCNLDAVLNVAKNIVSQIMSAKTISLDLIDLRSFDDYTYCHSVNVAVLSCITGMEMHLCETDILNLCIGAIFHDLGKSKISLEILNKPARLSKDEYEQIKRHSEESYNMIKERYDIPSTSKNAILCHHENEDGSGYPLGLTSDNIHLFAKIIHVMDVYDALTAKRPYKEPYAASEALEYLMGGCGIYFDKRVVDAFICCAPVFPKGMEIMLSDGREGIVVDNHKQNILRPVVRLFTGEIVDLGDELAHRNITIIPTDGNYQSYSRNLVQKERDDLKKHILLVDDAKFEIRTMQSILENDYRISTVCSGDQAIELFQKNEIPDLVLMDIEMPGRNGIETVQWMRDHMETEVPVIFVTGLSDAQTISKCRSLKAKDVIVKPFKPVYIKECVRRTLFS